jgi:hypothetical protein
MLLQGSGGRSRLLGQVTSRDHGEPYFFCSLECRERFELEPEDFLPLQQPARVPASVMLHLVS